MKCVGSLTRFQSAILSVVVIEIVGSVEKCECANSSRLHRKMVDKKTSALSVTSGLLVTLISMAVCGISIYLLVVSSDARVAIGESVSDIKIKLCYI